WHPQAREAIRGLAEGDKPWAIAWPCIHEFVGVVTHPGIYKPPTSLAAALL
ncbi:MAG: VapC toxin family PIN domain ribonuclease, partial [Betaproteobacteria bacterium]|nr:VapC toxin family PIN domain ribonuclease [Betaproteobacteria bacterium]